MAYVKSGTPIQEASGTTSRSPSIASVTAGNLLVLYCAWGSTGSSDTGPDLSAQGWTLVATAPTNTSHSFSLYVSIYYKANAASGTHTASITLSASDSQGEWLISEFSGYGTSPAVNVYGTNRWGVGGDVTTGSVSTSGATTVANTLICVAMSHDDASGVSDNHLTTPTSGYTSLFGNSNSITYNPSQFAYKEVTSTGTQTASIGSPTALTSGWGSGVIVAFASSTSSNPLSGDSTAKSSTTGALTTAIAMAASSIAKAATAMALTTTLTMGSDSLATTSSTAALTTQITMAATSKASPSTTASLTTGAVAPSIVSTTNIKQVWQSGTNWSSASVTVSQSGDAILTFMLAYLAGTLGQHYPCTDNNGTFTAAVDTGRPDPGSYPSYPQPLMSNIYYQLNAAVGTHTITPPYIGDAVNDDGNIWAVVVRGLPTTGTPRCTGHFHQVSNSAGTTFSSVSVSLDTPCQVGDVIFAVLGYDDDRPFGVVTLTDPSGWTAIAHETDAATNCPAAVFWKIATAADTETVSLSWNDPHGTVTDASIMAFAPATPAVSLNSASTTSTSTTAALTTSITMAPAATTAKTSTTTSLTTGIALVSASAASSASSGDMTTSITMAASSTAKSSTTIDILTGNGIAAGSVATSSSSAALTTSIPLTAASSGTAKSSAGLTTSIPLTAASAAQSSSTSALLTTAPVLAADSTAKASSTAALTTSIRFAAASSAKASTTIVVAGGTLTPRRALVKSATGGMRDILDAELGTGMKPLVFYNGRIKVRATTEGTPLVLVNGRLRALQLNETLTI